MSDLAASLTPIGVALALWWGGTGLILRAAAEAEKRPAPVMALASLIAIGAVGVIWLTADLATPGAAYAAFAAAILIWGWHELAFLTGLITGPRRAPCPEDCSGWVRFWCAAATLAHHEIALLATVTALYAVTLDAANALSFQTFAILWLMRLSAKLNLFLGIPTKADALLPKRLSYLASYFRERRMNPVFPISVTGGALGVGYIAAHGASLGASTGVALGGAVEMSSSGAFDLIAAALLATLLALAVLEHWFMIANVGDAALWRWMLPKDDPRRDDPARDDPRLVSQGRSSAITAEARNDAAPKDATPTPAMAGSVWGDAARGFVRARALGREIGRTAARRWFAETRRPPGFHSDAGAGRPAGSNTGRNTTPRP